jgi:hypothetical protein
MGALGEEENKTKGQEGLHARRRGGGGGDPGRGENEKEQEHEQDGSHRRLVALALVVIASRPVICYVLLRSDVRAAATRRV